MAYALSAQGRGAAATLPSRWLLDGHDSFNFKITHLR